MQFFNSRTSIASKRTSVVVGFAISVMLLMTIIAVISIIGIRRISVTSKSLEQSHQIVHKEGAILRDVTEAIDSVQDYIVTGKSESLGRYRMAKRKVMEELEALSRGFELNDWEMESLEKVRAQVAAELSRLDLVVERGSEFGQSGAFGLFSITASLFEDVDELHEKALSGHLHDAQRISRSIVVGALIMVGTTLFLLGFAALLVFRDTSALQAAEKELANERNLLRGLIDAIPNHVHVRDLHGRFMLANQALVTFLQKIKLGPVEGKTMADYFPKDTADLYSIRDSEVLESGRAVIGQEVPVEVGNGKTRWFSLNKVALRDSTGLIIGLVGVSEDVTQRKASEDRALNVAEQLRQSNQYLTDFASIASHDLQEPLRKIRAFGDRLAAKCEYALGEEGRDYLDRMQNAADRMQKLITDLLTLSRVTSKAKDFKPVDLKEVVMGVLADLEIQIEQSCAEIEVGRLPVLEADSLQMRQLFQNLISNALKFQRSGSKPIVFVSSRMLEVTERSLGHSEPGDEVCRIVVEDNGIGFEDKYAQRIFTGFHRLHPRTEYEGSGIGLAVCRKIAERHGGSITAKSGKDFGATFIVTLPVRQTSTLERS